MPSDLTIAYNNRVGCAQSSGSVQLVVNQGTTIQDEQGRNIRADELERGMTVDANFSTANCKHPAADNCIYRADHNIKQSCE